FSTLARIYFSRQNWVFTSSGERKCRVARGRGVAGQNKPRPRRRNVGAHQHERTSVERGTGLSRLARIGVSSQNWRFTSSGERKCRVARGRGVAYQNKPRPRRRNVGGHQHERTSVKRKIIVRTYPPGRAMSKQNSGFCQDVKTREGEAEFYRTRHRRRRVYPGGCTSS